VAGTDENSAPESEVLEQGWQGSGRLETLGRSRGVRLAASGLLATAVLGWLFLGPGVPGLTSARVQTAETAGTDKAPADPASQVVPPDQRDHECKSEGGGGSGRDAVGGRADAGSRALAAKLYRFARDPAGGTKVPWAQDVVLSTGNADRVLVPRTRVAGHDAWTSESGTADFLLADLAASKGRYHVDDTVHLDCRSHPRAVATRRGEASWISVQALSSARCSAWWAVDVFLDGQDRIARVSVTAR